MAKKVLRMFRRCLQLRKRPVQERFSGWDWSHGHVILSTEMVRTFEPTSRRLVF